MFIGKTLKAMRKENGMTQEQLANKAGLSVMTIRRLEADKREPKEEMIKRLADALEIDEVALYFNFDKKIFSEAKKYYYPLEEREPDNYTLMLNAFFKLNETGKEIAAQRVQELTEIERYTKPEPEEAKNAGEN